MQNIYTTGLKTNYIEVTVHCDYDLIFSAKLGYQMLKNNKFKPFAWFK